ncbi:hypothetical protein EV361DRAFT_965990 [Lentinula raphanica]|nr:hypothetical protein EV361DRAFT_965990 [Lentinula raphanica]
MPRTQRDGPLLQVVDGDIQAVEGVRVVKNAISARPDIPQGQPWIRIMLLHDNHQWPKSNSDLAPHQLCYSATPYAKSVVLLLLQQSGILSQDIVKHAFIHFVTDYNDVWALITKDLGFQFKTTVYDSEDKPLAHYDGTVRTSPHRDITYGPFGVLHGSVYLPSKFHAKLYHTGKVLRETKGEAEMGKCMNYLKAVFSKAEAHNKQLIVTPPSTQGPQLQVTTDHSAKRKRPSDEETPTQGPLPDSAISIILCSAFQKERDRRDSNNI